VAVAITAGAGIIRLVRATTPSGVFDEGFYVRDACMYVFGAGPECDAPEEFSPGHPPLGKWLIAVGIRMFGYRSGGWRAASLVAGTLTVLLLFVLARKILHSTSAAAIVSGLLAVDFLHFVHSRIAMLDVFVPLFGVAAFLCCVYDRDLLLVRAGRLEPDTAPHRLMRRGWRIAAGIAAGAAIASKWSGLPVLLAIIVLSLAWELKARRGAGHPVRRTLREEGPSMILAFLVIPAIVYTTSYAGRLDGSILAWPWADDAWLRSFVGRQRYMLRFHADLADAIHPYASPAWSWPLLKRPVLYFVEARRVEYRGILALGSPLVWWASLLAVLYTAVGWLRRRNLGGPEGVILAGFLAGWGPWLALSSTRPYMFLFYFLPSVPFMYLAVGYVWTRIRRSTAARLLFAALLVGSLASFAFYYPLLTAVPLPRATWEERILFRDCAVAGSEPRILPPDGSVTGAEDGLGGGEEGEASPTELSFRRTGRPPEGWCWL
jgi:dolichyl-phosphate-mannose--protein O-mannosyl transferase